MTVVDVGANTGVFSLWAERRGAAVAAAYRTRAQNLCLAGQECRREAGFWPAAGCSGRQSGAYRTALSERAGFHETHGGGKGDRVRRSTP